MPHIAPRHVLAPSASVPAHHRGFPVMRLSRNTAAKPIAVSEAQKIAVLSNSAGTDAPFDLPLPPPPPPPKTHTPPASPPIQVFIKFIHVLFSIFVYRLCVLA